MTETACANQAQASLSSWHGTRGNYARSEYIHELIAETYALLMRERIEGRLGQPPWLPNEIYQLISRIGI